jgi:ATP-dependent helicase HepA
MWEPGQKLVLRNDPKMGVGVVTGVEGRFIDVLFPDGEDGPETRRLSPEAAGITPWEHNVGDMVRGDDGPVEILQLGDGEAVLSDGTVRAVRDLWPDFSPPTLIDRLVEAKLDARRHLLNRIDGRRLMNLRREGVHASLMGGRVELFPHQLDTAARAIRDDTVRWLLADEVGLGKTIVACMITSALVRMGRVDRALIIAPDTLTVQWLGELYRKFHQVFVHIDAERLDDVRAEIGADANPFDVYPRAIVSYEFLEAEPGLRFAMERAQPDLIVIDEAHQAVGPAFADAILPIIEAAPHALLLTATPFQEEEAGFMRLVEAIGLDVAEDDGVRTVRHVSAVTRDDIQALGTREPHPVEVDHYGDLGVNDPRVAYLAEQLEEWSADDEKALLFVNDADRARRLHGALTSLTQKQYFLFHEEMPTAERDIKLAQFRISASPALISSGAGSEGRNFQFCDRLVHVDLPRDPGVLEQRIGRVDRIGRSGPIPIHYFRTGEEGELAALYERIGVFEDASVGALPQMSQLREALTHGVPPAELAELAASFDDAAVDHAKAWRFPDSHDKADADEVLAQLPDDLDELIERFVFSAAHQLEFDVVEKDGQSVYFFEWGDSVRIDAIPGLHAGSRYLGTFDRDEAVTRDELDFFSNGHPLVEGLLAELEDSERGRVGAIHADDLAPQLKGVYLLVTQGRESFSRPQLVPLADAARLTRQQLALLAKQIVARIDDNVVTANPRQVRTLMSKLKAVPAFQKLDADEVDFLLLIVAM